LNSRTCPSTALRRAQGILLWTFKAPFVKKAHSRACPSTSSGHQISLSRNLVEAAEVESEADTTTIRVYANLPNVYRITDILLVGTRMFKNKMITLLFVNTWVANIGTDGPFPKHIYFILKYTI
jgi:hypothetical protein